MSTVVPIDPNHVSVIGSPFNNDNPERTKIQFNIDPNLGKFEMDLVSHPYFGVAETYAVFNRDVLILPVPTREVHYGLALMHGPGQSARFEDRDWVNVSRGETYLTHNPGVTEQHRFKANHALDVTFLEIKETYLTKLLMNFTPERHTPLWQFRDQVSRGEFAGVGGGVFIPEFYNVIKGMMNCPISGPLGNLMLEGYLQQLMALQFAMLGASQKAETVSRRDRDVLYAVKDYLHSTVDEEHSLLDLSRKFGINQNKLKTGFRELFGMPVIAYLYDLKMKHARTLLLERDMHVSEVARLVGYRNANHFSTAFRRKFGINPSKISRI